MRSWLTTREVRLLLGGLSQQRISQLVKAGELIVDRDAHGYLKYDRAAAEAFVSERAARRAGNAAAADERRALQAEARERLARERRKHAAEQAARAAKQETRWERLVAALEKLASKPCR